MSERTKAVAAPLDGYAAATMARVVHQQQANDGEFASAAPGLQQQSTSSKTPPEPLPTDPKERKQLRNKQSARAFRERRKNYVEGLETELRAKTAQGKDLKANNAALEEENAQMRAFLAAFDSLPNGDMPSAGMMGQFPPADQTRLALQNQVAANRAAGKPGGLAEQILSYADLIAASKRKSEGA